jgi:hypothetical protein
MSENRKVSFMLMVVACCTVQDWRAARCWPVCLAYVAMAPLVWLPLRQVGREDGHAACARHCFGRVDQRGGFCQPLLLTTETASVCKGWLTRPEPGLRRISQIWASASGGCRCQSNTAKQRNGHKNRTDYRENTRAERVLKLVADLQLDGHCRPLSNHNLAGGQRA